MAFLDLSAFGFIVTVMQVCVTGMDGDDGADGEDAMDVLPTVTLLFNSLFLLQLTQIFEKN